MMKTLIFFGSARKNGVTMKMIQELMKNIDGDVEIIDSYETDIKPCTDCRHCFYKNECSINDYMQEIYIKIEEADNIIFASPVYFFSIPCKLKTIIDRFQIYFARRIRKDTDKNIKNRKVAYIMTGGAPFFENQFLGVRLIFDAVSRELNLKFVGEVTFSNSDKMDFEHNQQVLSNLRKIAISLN